MYLVILRHASKPRSVSAPLKIVSAEPVSADDKNPQSDASIMATLSSSITLPIASASLAGVTSCMSCFSAQIKIFCRMGALDMKYLSTLPFQ